MPIEGCHTLPDGAGAIGPAQGDAGATCYAAHTRLGGHPHIAHAVDGQFEHTIVRKAFGHTDMARRGVADGPRRANKQKAGCKKGEEPAEKHGLKKGY